MVRSQPESYDEKPMANLRSMKVLTPVGAWEVFWDDSGIISARWDVIDSGPHVLPWTVDKVRATRNDPTAHRLGDWLKRYRSGNLEGQDNTMKVWTWLSPRTRLPLFFQAVWKAVSQIPPGNRLSYSDVARILGREGATRAVGQAMARNPWPLLVPCHRVVNRNGTYGGYTPDVRIKAWLLEWESSTYPENSHKEY